MCGPYEVPYIPHGLRHEETILQIANALDYLNFVVNDVFSHIEKKAEQQQQRLITLKTRTANAKCKVDKLNGCKKATVVQSNPKYPASGIYKDYESSFDFDNPKPFKFDLPKVKSRFQPVEEKHLEEKLKYFHVKVSSKLLHRNIDITPEEGLGILPADLSSVSNLLLFNTSENPYKQYVMLDPLGKIAKSRHINEAEEQTVPLDAPPLSITQQEQLDHHFGVNYFYSPGLGEVPLIDVPLDLPDLPGVADDLRYNLGSSEPVIAPSGSNTPAAPELPSLPLLQNEIADTTPEVPHAPEKANVTHVNNVQENAPTQLVMTVPPPPPPPPPPPQEKYEHETHVRTNEVSQQENNSVPKEQPTDGIDARANLMEAIRKAGGKANLKSVESKKKKQDGLGADAEGGSRDLMSDLHAKLSMRRKGISGQKSESVVGAMQRISAMIPPPSSVSDNFTNNTDDDDWD